MNKKIVIIGSGALASALGLVLSDMKFKNILIYGIDQNELDDLKRGQNTKYFSKEVILPKFQITNNLKIAINNARYIVLAIPSKVIRIVFEKIVAILNSKVVIINGSKGFYPKTNLLIHSGLEKASHQNKYVQGVVSIIGPSHAEEIVLRHPTLVSIIGMNKNLNLEVYQLFQTPYFKCYIQEDVIGAEVGAAYKNVLAIASGLAKGIGYGINTQAVIITKGLLEMSHFSKIMGAKPLTIYGLTGLGDLIATATSDLSRNFQYGQSLFKHKKNHNSQPTIEGLVALEYIYKIGKKHQLDLPITYTLYNIIFKNSKIKKEIIEIWKSKKIYE